jgi:hypothetical protein
VRVEPGRDDQPGRRELGHPGRHQLVERTQVDIAGRARRHRHIHREPLTRAEAHFVGAAGAGIQRPLVQADEQHARIVVEHGLRAVAVVRVVVDDQHPLTTLGQRGSHHRHVRHEAEAHRLVLGGVVTRRTHRAERRVATPGLERRHRREPGASRQTRRLVRAGAGIGVRIEPTTTARTDRLDAVEVGRRVDPLEVGPRGCHRREWGERIEQPLALDARQHGAKALRSLRVARSGEVVEVRRVGTEQHGHGDDATVLDR